MINVVVVVLTFLMGGKVGLLLSCLRLGGKTGIFNIWFLVHPHDDIGYTEDRGPSPVMPMADKLFPTSNVKAKAKTAMMKQLG